MLKIHTSAYRYSGKDRLDITAKGQDAIGKLFAPPWNLVMAYKEHRIDEAEYTDQYSSLMTDTWLSHPDAWKNILTRDEVTLVCFCKAGTFCHRYILARFLCQIGNAVYMGERGKMEEIKDAELRSTSPMPTREEDIDYAEELMTFAKTCLTTKGFELLLFIDEKIPDVWDRPSSSTGKYHKKANGSVPTIAHHTYEMLYAASKTIRMLGGALISTRNDALLMGIILHDALKYGPTGKTPHTSRTHEKEMADLLAGKPKLLKKHFNEDEIELLIDVIRFHSGRWSTDVPKAQQKDFDFKDYRPEVLIVHFLDMLSTADVLTFPSLLELPF